MVRISRRMWLNNNKIDLAEIVLVWGGGWNGWWPSSGQGQVESSCRCGNERSGSKKCLET
jgi:hypothetical protein